MIVADQLRDAIFSGTYQAGDRLVERTIASELGVSHIPVREALARLVDEGIVEHIPRRGSRVLRLDLRTLEEISEARVLLEQHVVLLVQSRWSSAIEDDLRSIAHEMSEAAEGHQFPRLLELDCLFHERLWEESGNRIMIEFLAHLRGQLNVFLGAAARTLQPSEFVQHGKSHDALIDEIASGDAARASEAVEVHITSAVQRVATTLQAPGGSQEVSTRMHEARPIS